MMCAAQAGQRGRRVLLIEHYPRSARRSASPAAAAATSPTSSAGPAQLSFAQSGVLPRRRSRATRPRTSCAWSSATASPITRRSWASSSATTRPQDDHRMLKTECERGRRRRGACRVPVDGRRHDGRRFRVTTAQGAVTRSVAGHRHRRPHRAQDRRHAVRLPHCRAVRSCRRAAASGAGPARLRAGRARALRRPVRHFARRGGRVRRGPLSREPAVHPSRSLGPGDPADLVVLGRPRAACRSTCCRASMRARGWQSRARSDARLAQPARGTLAEALRAAVVRRARRRSARCASSAPKRCARSRAICTPGRCCRRERSGTTRPR